jgi:predicted ATP-binding protein involved in virulence
MKIAKVSVTKLFGVFDHSIPLNTNERITIIHGPNGFGKTVLLRMIDGLFTGRMAVFYRIPFSTFRVDFTDESFIELEKKNDEESKKTKILLLTSGQAKPILLQATSVRNQEFPLGAIDSFIPELDRVGPDEWHNSRTGQTLSLDDVVEKYGDLLEKRGLKMIGRPEALKKISTLIKTHFIKTERLRSHVSAEVDKYSSRRVVENSTSAIVEYSKDLARRIQENLAKSVEYSSSLDRSFPMRLVGNIAKQKKLKFAEKKIRDELAELEEKRARLMTAGLLDTDQGNFQLPEESVDEFTRLVLSIYVNDVRDKLSVFDNDLKKIELFRDIISKRFGYKKFSISKEKGFIFTAVDGSELALDSLSSGEQHETVLLYELLFRVPENSLILMDEPEISLHIGWQQEFLQDFIEITKLSGFDLLITTHSPDIINDRWDLTVPLKGPDES